MKNYLLLPKSVKMTGELMNKVYFLLGSNMGDRLGNIQKAKALIEKEIGKVSRASSVYETEAWGKAEQSDFLNLALLCETKWNGQQILEKIILMEKKMGRIRKEKWEARLIDIDILFYNEEVIEEENLKIPHPHLHKRRFTLVPLAEIAPHYIHPELKKTTQELLAECTDRLSVRPYAQS